VLPETYRGAWPERNSMDINSQPRSKVRTIDEPVSDKNIRKRNTEGSTHHQLYIRGRPHKIAKNWPSLFTKCPHSSTPLPPLSMLTYLKFRKVRRFSPKSAAARIWKTFLARKMSALDKLPTTDIFYRQPLSALNIEASTIKQKKVTVHKSHYEVL